MSGHSIRNLLNDILTSAHSGKDNCKFPNIMNIRLKNADVFVGWQILMWWITRKIIYEPVSTWDKVVLDVFLRKL